MEFNTAFNKPNSFFSEKKAVASSDITNRRNDIILKGSEVTITGRSRGFKVFFDIVSESGTHIDNVSYENLNLK